MSEYVTKHGTDVNGHAYTRQTRADEGARAGSLGSGTRQVGAPTAVIEAAPRTEQDVLDDIREALRGERDTYNGEVATILVPADDLRLVKGQDSVAHDIESVRVPVAELRELAVQLGSRMDEEKRSRPLTAVQIPEPKDSKVLNTEITGFNGYGPRSWYGAKYESGRYVSAKEIAKNLRGDIASLIRAGELPGKEDGFVYSVRARTYSGGQSVDIGIAHVNAQSEYDDTWAQNPDYDPDDRDFGWGRPSRYRPEVTAATKLLEAAIQQYQRDNSDVMTDYFDVNFYGHVNVTGRKPPA